MDESVPVQRRLSDQPFVDNTLYGSGKDDSITDTTENYAITHRSVTIGETIISYTAHAGHLVTYDQDSAQPSGRSFIYRSPRPTSRRRIVQ
ncbi:MAG: hypothetical protein WA395_15455 [Nitrososphaeraceae archaeon]